MLMITLKQMTEIGFCIVIITTEAWRW